MQRHQNIEKYVGLPDSVVSSCQRRRI